MTVRKVVLERPGLVRIAEVEPRPAADGQATVRLRAAGICGSDLSAFRGTSALVTYPRVLGHEILVEIMECPGRPELRGQRAVLDPMLPCHHCDACRAGRHNCCARLQVMGVHIDGGLQEVWTVDIQSLFPVPDSMPDDLAVLAEPLTIAYQAVKRSNIQAGQTGLVLGAGTIGLLIASLLVRGRGCRALVVDPNPQRLNVAQTLGAVAVPGSEAELVSRVARETGGDMANMVFEASGSASATAITTALVAHAGTIVLVGWNRGPVEIDTVTLMRKELDLLGSRNSLNAFPAVIRLLADGVIDADELVTHRYGIAEARDALDVLDKGQDHALKVLIKAG